MTLTRPLTLVTDGRRLRAFCTESTTLMAGLEPPLRPEPSALTTSTEFASVPGPLTKHFCALAHSAGVNLNGVFALLKIKRTNPPDARSTQGMARLARHLGVDEGEAQLRLRFDFALASRTSARGELAAALQLANARQTVAASETFSAARAALRRCETDYGPRRRKDCPADPRAAR